MTIKNWIFYVLSSILSIIMLASVILMCIPSTRQAIADKIAIDLSPAYSEIKDENAKQKSEIDDLKNKLNNLNNTIAEKDSLIAIKDSKLKEKDDTIANYETQLDTCKNNIETLSTQKVLLCNSLTEIDNKINFTTDSVELENLETKKSAILNQIDTLNSEIATLTEQKTQLETDIETLQQEKVTLQNEIVQLKTEKANLQAEVTNLQEQVTALENSLGISCDFSYLTSGYVSLREDKIGVEFINSISKSSLKELAEETLNKKYFQKMSRISFSYNGVNAATDVCDGEYEIATCEIYHKGTLIENAYDYIILLDGDLFQTYVTVSIYENDSSKLSLKINIVDFILSGKYTSSSGKYIDFDNNVDNVFGASISEKIVLDYSYYNDNIYLRKGAYIVNCSLSDNNQTLTINDEIFCKESTQPTEPETPTGVTADKILIKIKGSIDEHNYYLINFSESNGTLIKYYDTIIVDSNPLEFVNFDLESNILTFNNTKSGTQIVLSDVAYETIGNGYKIKSAIYDGISLVIFD